MKKSLGLILIFSSFLGLLDQISKYLIVKYLKTPLQIINNFFKLEYSENTGIAFGIPIPHFAILVLNLFLICFVIYFAFKELNLSLKATKLALSLLLGGAMGNIIDRLTNGYVVDFISISRWPNFNLADTFITTAILLIILFYGKIKRK